MTSPYSTSTSQGCSPNWKWDARWPLPPPVPGPCQGQSPDPRRLGGGMPQCRSKARSHGNRRDRYNNAAILITSQLPLAKWHDVIGEPTFADTILDRIVHNAHRIDLDGPLMRKTIAENFNTTAVDHVERNNIKGTLNGDDHEAKFDPRLKWPFWIGISCRFHRNAHLGGKFCARPVNSLFSKYLGRNIYR